MEAHWAAALKQRETLPRRYRAVEPQPAHEGGPKAYALLQAWTADMARGWSASSTTMEDRKPLLRYVVTRGHLAGGTETGRIGIEGEWHTGAHTATTIARAVVGAWAPRTPAAVEPRLQELLPSHTQTQIAQSLKAEGFHSATGQACDSRTVRYMLQSRGWQVQQKAPPTGRM